MAVRHAAAEEVQVIGQINFGPTAEASFLRGQIAMQAMQITDLEAEVTN
jgi:hypothetical protein